MEGANDKRRRVKKNRSSFLPSSQSRPFPPPPPGALDLFLDKKKTRDFGDKELTSPRSVVGGWGKERGEVSWVT